MQVDPKLLKQIAKRLRLFVSKNNPNELQRMVRVTSKGKGLAVLAATDGNNIAVVPLIHESFTREVNYCVDPTPLWGYAKTVKQAVVFKVLKKGIKISLGAVHTELPAQSEEGFMVGLPSIGRGKRDIKGAWKGPVPTWTTILKHSSKPTNNDILPGAVHFSQKPVHGYTYRYTSITKTLVDIDILAGMCLDFRGLLAMHTMNPEHMWICDTPEHICIEDKLGWINAKKLTMTKDYAEVLEEAITSINPTNRVKVDRKLLLKALENMKSVFGQCNIKLRFSGPVLSLLLMGEDEEILHAEPVATDGKVQCEAGTKASILIEAVKHMSEPEVEFLIPELDKPCDSICMTCGDTTEIIALLQDESMRITIDEEQTV